MLDKIKENKKWVIIILSIIGLIVIDQVIKLIAINMIGQDGSINIIPNILNFTYVENTGGAFGVAKDSLIIVIITNLLVLGVIIKFMISQSQRIERRINVVLTIIIAGGFSNLIDRILRGFVVDFIDFSPVINFPKFNLADILIVIGWILLAAFFAAYSARELEQRKKKR